MPDYARSDLEVAQKACVLAGMNPPQSFEELNATEAKVLNVVYEDVVRDALTSTPWNFASQQLALTGRLAAAPLVKWSAAYQLPQDGTILTINTIYVDGSVADYDIEGTRIMLDCSDISLVTLDYLKRVEVSGWPPFFTMYVIQRLAAILSSSIARSDGMAKSFSALAEAQLARARSRDSQQVTARGVKLNRFVRFRRGGF